MNRKIFTTPQEEISYYKTQVDMLSMEKNNLQTLINCIMGQSQQEILKAKRSLEEGSDLNRGLRSATQSSSKTKKNINDKLIFQKRPTLQDQLLQSKSDFNINHQVKLTCLTERSGLDHLGNSSRDNNEKDRNQFVEIDILHQTCRLIQRQEQSNAIHQIFSKHFVSAKNLYLMIKMQQYDHALMKMITFCNEILNLVLRLRQKEKNQFQQTIVQSRIKTSDIFTKKEKSYDDMIINKITRNSPYMVKILEQDQEVISPKNPKCTDLKSDFQQEISILDTFGKAKTPTMKFSQAKEKSSLFSASTPSSMLKPQADQLKEFLLKLIKRKQSDNDHRLN